jgi:hypothetical protein
MKYLMQFTKHKASCVLEYNEEGSLVQCDFQPGTFDEQEYKLFFNNFPTKESKIAVWKKQNFKTLKIEKFKEDINFDSFYDKYNHKLSKRSRSENIWKVMDNNEKAKAIAFISTYEKYLAQTGVAKKNPETYLNAEMWNN